MSDQQTMGNFAEIEARLRRDLAEIADRIAPPINDRVDHLTRQAPETANELEQRSYVSGSRSETEVASRRRLGRLVIVAAAAAVTLVLAGGILLLARDGDPDQIKMVPPTSGPTPTTEPIVVVPSTVPEVSTTTVAAEADEEADAVAIALPSVAATRVEGEPVTVAGTELTDVAGGEPSLGPWDDGFLLVDVTGGEQLVPQPTDEMLARMPPEFLAVYPEGLTGPSGEAITLQEATSRLEEDGLLDVVSAALDADPELNEWVLGGSTTPVNLLAEFSLDGEAWTPVEITAPPDIVPEYVAVMAGRVVLLGTSPLDVTSELVDAFQTMIVASTLDLEAWSVQTVPDVVETLSEVSIVANASGWVAHIEPDLCNRDGSCGWPGTPSDGYNVPDGPPLTWAASWDSEPVPVQGMPSAEGVVIVALQTGFLAQQGVGAHERIEFSFDGVTWVPVPVVPAGAVQGALPLDDGSSVVVMWTSPCGPPFFRVDETGQNWEPIDLNVEGIPTGLLPRSWGPFDSPLQRMSRTSAALFDETGPTIRTTLLEQSGLRLMMRSCPEWLEDEDWYELTDAESGEVLVSESSWVNLPRGGAFEYLTLDADGITVRDPATGEDLFVAGIDRDPFDTDLADGVWLLATADGRDWLFDRVPGSRFGNAHRDLRVARNGDIMLVQIDQSWLRYDLPRG